MTQEIEGAMWYEDDTNTRWIGEDGTTDGQPRDRMTFVTIPYRSIGAAPAGELCDVSYFIAKNFQERPALFRTEDCTLDPERQEDEHRLELTDLAVGFDVTYYDAEGPHDEWPPDLAVNAPLPCRVRIALTLRDQQGYERAFITTVPVFMRGDCEEAP
jgi:hypothetical protein